MQTICRTTLISVSVLAVCAISLARLNAQSSPSSPSPSAELVALTRALEGKWSLSVKFESNSSTANGLASTGEETWRAGPGGFTLLEEEHLAEKDHGINSAYFDGGQGRS